MRRIAIETEPDGDQGRQHRSVTDRVAERLGRITVFGHRIDDSWAELRRRRVPTHWTNLFGIVTLASLVVVTVTGILLMFFYTPSSEATVYTGSYAPLHGATVSEAFASTMHVTFDVPGGVVLRQAHHWAALLLPAAITVQLVTTFFTGAFRRPRRALWVLLLLALIAALASGWSGYALPDDMLSGTGLRIVEGILLGIPVIGTWLASILFGGPFPGRIIENLYPLHIVVFPGALLVLVALRAIAAWRHGPPQFPGRGRTPENVVGVALIPTAATRAGGLFLVVTGLLLLISATVTVSPDLALRPGRPGQRRGGEPARLVHRVPRRGAAPRAARLGARVAGAHLDDGDPRPAGRRRRLLRGRRRLPVPGGVGHGRPRRPPSPRPAAPRPDAHRPRSRRSGVRGRALGRGRRRHHRHGVLGEHRARDHRTPGGTRRRADPGVHGRSPHVLRPAAEETPACSVTATRRGGSSACRAAGTSRSTGRSTRRSGRASPRLAARRTQIARRSAALSARRHTGCVGDCGPTTTAAPSRPSPPTTSQVTALAAVDAPVSRR